jgi:acylphosphatase
MSDVIRRRVRVFGMVQGVAFRYTCEQEAARAGVAGWARNDDDGSVEAAFEGPREAVEAMCRWCEHGPRSATVERVEIEDEAPTGEDGFRVRG